MGREDDQNPELKSRKTLHISDEALRNLLNEDDGLEPSVLVRNVRDPGSPGDPPGAG